jgi:opacity protein-like surface antigen
MKAKRSLWLAAALLLVLASAAHAADAVRAVLFPVTYVFNHEVKEPDPEYVTLNYNGRTYVPVRFVAENLGARVNYDENSRTVTINGSNVFDARHVEEGQIIAGMEVVRFDLAGPADDLTGYVSFKGKTLISGTYRYDKSDELHGEMLSFTVDETSLDRIPIMSHDDRMQWFMIRNLEEAKTMLGIGEGIEETTGKAAIVIEDYGIHRDYADVYNTARVVEAYIQR